MCVDVRSLRHYTAILGISSIRHAAILRVCSIGHVAILCVSAVRLLLRHVATRRARRACVEACVAYAAAPARAREEIICRHERGEEYKRIFFTNIIYLYIKVGCSFVLQCYSTSGFPHLQALVVHHCVFQCWGLPINAQDARIWQRWQRLTRTQGGRKQHVNYPQVCP